MGTIYLHKNKINGKCYVGQTSYTSESAYLRWGVNGKNYPIDDIFGKAIKKYGWNNFEHIFLKENIDIEHLDYWEEYYIKEYHTYIRDPLCNGYNSTPGGKHTSTYTWEPEEDRFLLEEYSTKISRQKLYEMFIKQFPNTCHTQQAVYARLKTLRLSNITNVNFWTEEEDLRLVETYHVLNKTDLLAAFPNRNMRTIIAEAKKLHLTRKVDCNPNYTSEEEKILFDYYEKYGPNYCNSYLPNRSINSIRDHATKVLHLHCHEKYTEKVGFDLNKFKELYISSGVKPCMRQFNLSEAKVRSIASQYKLKQDLTSNTRTARFGPVPKAVYCIELDQTFKDCKEAGEFIGLKPNACRNIIECCKGKRFTAGGYHWKYINKGEQN